MADSDVQVKFGATIDDLVEGVGQAKEQIASLGESLDSIKDRFTDLAGLFGIAFGVDAIKNWIESSAELGEQMERAGAKLGITAQQASQLSGIATLTGTSFQEMELQLERLQLGLATTGQESSRTAQALNVLGVNAKSFAALPMLGQVDALAAAFSRFQDGPTKTAAAMALLGRAGADMLPFLDKGREGIEELQEILQRTGAVMTNEMADSFAHTKEDISEMSLAWQGLSNKLFDVVNPAIDGAIRQFTALIESIKPEVLRGQIADFVGEVGKLTADIVEFCVEAVGAIKELIAIVGSLSQTVSGASQEPPHIVGFVSTGTDQGDSDKQDELIGLQNLNDALQGKGLSLTQTLAKIDEDTKARVASIRESITDFSAGVSGAIRKTPSLDPRNEGAGQGGSGYTPPPKPQVPQMQLGGGKGGDQAAKDALAAQLTDYQIDVDAFRAAAKQKETQLDEQLKVHQITMAQWLQQTTDALEDEKQDVQATYAAELATVGLTSKQIEDIKKQEQLALAAIAQQEQNAQYKAAEYSAQQWQTAVSTIQGAFTGQIDSLLKGTETWRQAMINVADDIAEKLIAKFVDIAIEWALQLSGMQALYMAFQAKIDAISATGGLFKGLSGLLGGLLAPFTGGASLALGEAAGVGSSYAVGSWSIPNDGMAYLHQDEMVVPAAQTPWAQSLMSNAAAGGAAGGASNTAVHFNISAIDGNSVYSMLRTNGQIIARIVQQVQARNPSLA